MPFSNPFVPVNFINKSVTPTGTPDIDAAFLNYFQSIVDAQGDGLATYSSDLETLEATVTALGAPYTDTTHISGLKVTTTSTTQIVVTSGSCYVPATNRIVSKSTDTTINTTGLAIDTWYYVYAIDTAGALSFEYVTTQPALYMGTAKQKSGDSSRRYVGEFRTAATTTNIIQTSTVGNKVSYRPAVQGYWFSLPFQLVNGKQTTSLDTYQVTDGAGGRDSAPHLCRLVTVHGINQSGVAGSQLLIGDPATLSQTVHEHYIEHTGVTSGRNNWAGDVTLNSNGQFAARMNSASTGDASIGVAAYYRER